MGLETSKGKGFSNPNGPVVRESLVCLIPRIARRLCRRNILILVITLSAAFFTSRLLWLHHVDIQRTADAPTKQPENAEDANRSAETLESTITEQKADNGEIEGSNQATADPQISFAGMDLPERGMLDFCSDVLIIHEATPNPTSTLRGFCAGDTQNLKEIQSISFCSGAAVAAASNSPNARWYIFAGTPVVLSPEPLLRFLKQHDSTNLFVVGRPAFSVLGEDQKLVHGPRGTPYGPAENLSIMQNFKHASSDGMLIVSNGLMSALRRDPATLENYCTRGLPDALALSLANGQLGGRFIAAREFADIPAKQPELSVALKRLSKSRPTFVAVSSERFGPTEERAIYEILGEPKKSNVVEGLLSGDAKNDCQNEISLQQEALISIYTDLLKGISKVALLGFPDHSNKGDSAIWVGEKILLEALGIEVVYIARTLSDFNATEMARILQVTPSEGTTTKISKSRKDFVESAILFHGGGNFGDLYWTHQELRNSVVNGFPQIRIVSFPQTVHFSSSSSPALAKVIEAYRLHNHLTIVARDVQSFNFLAKHLGTHQIRLAPDVAFMIGSVAGRISTVPQDEAASSTKSKQLHQKWDVLVHQRSDKESTPDQRSRAAWETLRFDGVSSTFSFKIDDWLGTANSKYGWIPDLNKRAYRRLEDGLDFLAQGRLVITNRLHGHILLTLMGVPHIVLDNLHSKVLNYYSAWTKSCGLARFATSVPEAIILAHQHLTQSKWGLEPNKVPTESALALDSATNQSESTDQGSSEVGDFSEKVEGESAGDREEQRQTVKQNDTVQGAEEEDSESELTSGALDDSLAEVEEEADEDIARMRQEREIAKQRQEYEKKKQEEENAAKQSAKSVRAMTSARTLTSTRTNSLTVAEVSSPTNSSPAPTKTVVSSAPKSGNAGDMWKAASDKGEKRVRNSKKRAKALRKKALMKRIKESEEMW